jgi:hypothetical protein
MPTIRISPHHVHVYFVQDEECWIASHLRVFEHQNVKGRSWLEEDESESYSGHHITKS